MEIMVKLYNKGFLSYPRTETNCYNKTINLQRLIGNLTGSNEFGGFAKRLEDKKQWKGPRNGRLDDEAHPPIHPVNLAAKNQLTDL